MRIWEKLRSRVRSLFHTPKVDRELQDELSFHLDQLTEENIAAGVEPGEARKLAMRKMGGIPQLQEQCRDTRRLNLVDDLLRDLRYAARSLSRSPGFTVLAVLIMALGIGANTAVFNVVNAVLLKPLAYRDPDRIVTISATSTKSEVVTTLSKQISILEFWEWHDRSSSFDAIAYYSSRETAVLPGSTAEYAQATGVSPEFFRVLAVEPVLGRFFTTEEMKQGGSGALMISHAYWQSHFAGNPRVLGQTIRLLGRTLPVAGVLPPGFQFPNKTDIWFPAMENPKVRYAGNYLAIGRLKAGVSVERAQSEMASISRRIEEQYPERYSARSVVVARMRDEMVKDFRLTLYLLLGAVSVVLLIACANTATLLLGRATARAREVAVRVALGASRQRIIRQMITESLLLSFLAGVSGLLLAYWGSKALVALAPANVPRLTESGIDAWVLAFTFCISMITSMLFGLVPALYAARVDLNDTLKQGGTRSVIGGRMVRMRGALVIAEIALAVVLLAGAGLLMKSFVALHNVALGFRPENVLVMKATVPAPRVVANRFFKDVLSQISTVPSVLAAGATMAPPGYVDSTGRYYVDHMPATRDPGAPSVALSIIAPGTFAALGIPIKNGRDFTEGDTSDRPFVAVINEAIARKSFPGADPIGRTIFCTFDTSTGMTIVGVVGDVRQLGPAREPMPECYMPYQQHPYNGSTLSVVVRTVGDPSALAETVRRLARDTSPDVPVKFTTMEATLAENVAAPRFRTLLIGIFAALAVCLAMAGVYGVMAYAVGQRSNEIGLRMAMGAGTGSVLRLILGQGLSLAAIGLALGLVVAAPGARLLKTMLFQVQPNDPWIYVGVTVLLGFVALLASYVPASRAARIDPITALRQE